MIYNDPVTGRPYTVDPDGTTRWADNPTGAPAVTGAPFDTLTIQQQPVAGPGHARSGGGGRKRGPLLPVLAAAGTGLVGLVAGVGIGVGIGGAGAGGTTSAAPTVTVTGPAVTYTVTPPAGGGTPAPAVGPGLGNGTVDKSDYKATLKVLSKQCFGSAGCNVEARIQLAIVTPDADGKAAEIQVTVKGDESGPVVETISVDEDGNYSAPSVSLSTRRSSTKVTAVVTGAEEA